MIQNNLKILSPEIHSTDGSYSPIRYKGMSRVTQLNISKLLLRACQPPSSFNKQLNNYKDLIVITTKTPIVVNINPVKQKRKQSYGGSNNKSQMLKSERKKFHRIPQTQLIKQQTTSTIKNNRSTIQSKKIYNQKSNRPKLLPQLKNQKKAIKSKNLPLLIYQPQELKHVKSQSYIMIEHPSNNIVVSHNSNLSLEIASLTKIMTCYVILKICQNKRIDIKTQKVIVDDYVMETSGTVAEILGGQQYTIEQLLYGLMLPSGNDAALCLAEWGGSFYTNSLQSPVKTKAFIHQMNKTSKILNLEGTRFGNPHGLPNLESKSTALDVAMLCSTCLAHQTFLQIVSTKNYTCTIQNPQMNTKRQVEWENTNKLLRRQNFIGLKTGITVTAGPCLASAYKFKQKIYITVVLRASKISRRFKDTRRILYWAISKLYKGDLNQNQNKTLHHLKKNKPEIDSDNSQDQNQFKYQLSSQSQYKKRCNIISYEL